MGINTTAKVNTSPNCPYHGLQISIKSDVSYERNYEKNQCESGKSGHFAVMRFAVGGAADDRWGFEHSSKHIWKVEMHI